MSRAHAPATTAHISPQAEFDPKSLKFTEKAQVQLHLPDGDRKAPRPSLLARASARAFDGESLHLCVWENAATAAAAERRPATVAPYGAAKVCA